MRRYSSRLFLATIAIVAAGSARAAQQCFFSYQEFEKAVPHFDLNTCPGAPLDPAKGFCRLALDGLNVRVYRFVYVAKEACLESVAAMTFAAFVERHGVSYEAK